VNWTAVVESSPSPCIRRRTVVACGLFDPAFEIADCSAAQVGTLGQRFLREPTRLAILLQQLCERSHGIPIGYASILQVICWSGTRSCGRSCGFRVWA
jgi:hypothetical protein